MINHRLPNKLILALVPGYIHITSIKIILIYISQFKKVVFNRVINIFNSLKSYNGNRKVLFLSVSSLTTKTGKMFNISHYIVFKKTKWEAAPSHSGCFLPGDSVTVLTCLITSALLTGELEQLICVSGKSGKSNAYAQPSDFPFGMFGKAACKDLSAPSSLQVLLRQTAAYRGLLQPIISWDRIK